MPIVLPKHDSWWGSRFASVAAVDAAGGAGFADLHGAEGGEVRAELRPDPPAEVLAGGVLQALDLLNVVERQVQPREVGQVVQVLNLPNDVVVEPQSGEHIPRSTVRSIPEPGL